MGGSSSQAKGLSTEVVQFVVLEGQGGQVIAQLCSSGVLAPHDLQDWQEQICREPHQTTLESKDLAFLDSERALSMYVFVNDIYLCFCFLILG